MSIYINIKQDGEVETVDEFDTRKDAREALDHYQSAFKGSCGTVYISTRCTREWREASDES